MFGKKGFGWSKCFDATWLENFYEESFSADEFVGISVGCNKGFDSIKTARIGFNDHRFNSSSWQHHTFFEKSYGA